MTFSTVHTALPLPTFVADPASERSGQILAERTHALLGISPFNSRFSLHYILRLCAWAVSSFEKVDILLAGEDAALQLEALGTPRGKARYKARKAVRRNRRDVEAALTELDLRDRVGVYCVDEFVNCAAYIRWRNDAAEAFSESHLFREACLSMSKQAIAGRQRVVSDSLTPITEEQANLAVGYVLAELPFFLATPEIFDVPASVLVYHRPWELGEKIFCGEFPISQHPDQGYITVVPAIS
ncbi:tRNA-dependent cyclodipeptide synthase [Corynebacterium lizhenjunii]|uniref:tRNA-dependent cyclodipeptide synthase n=1 Tax=Corynebacterium lizhenjunii TaxID=2709394 RepID=UPI0013ECE2FC|nr:tRNA-dependent cyclodipeptide synthase [Corynebacterium lizhenjunii]